MKNKTKGLLFKIPAMLLLLGAFIASIVVKVTNSYDINLGPIVLLAIIVILYFIGEYFSMKQDSLF